MIRLFYRDHTTGDPSTFVARVDDPVVLVIGELRRTDVSAAIPIILPCWVMSRGRKAPVYERPAFPMRRLGAESWVVLGVPFAAGDREDVYLVDVFEVTGNEWSRRAFALAELEPQR